MNLMGKLITESGGSALLLGDWEPSNIKRDDTYIPIKANFLDYLLVSIAWLASLSVRLLGQKISRNLPAIVKEASARLRPCSTSPSRVRSMAKAEIAKSIFFFLSKRLIERKFNLQVKKNKKPGKKNSKPPNQVQRRKTRNNVFVLTDI